jgi:hypothetical protein
MGTLLTISAIISFFIRTCDMGVDFHIYIPLKTGVPGCMDPYSVYVDHPTVSGRLSICHPEDVPSRTYLALQEPDSFIMLV